MKAWGAAEEEGSVELDAFGVGSPGTGWVARLAEVVAEAVEGSGEARQEGVGVSLGELAGEHDGASGCLERGLPLAELVEPNAQVVQPVPLLPQRLQVAPALWLLGGLSLRHGREQRSGIDRSEDLGPLLGGGQGGAARLVGGGALASSMWASAATMKSVPWP